MPFPPFFSAKLKNALLRGGGFSLIELLVVVAIVSMLMVLAVPAFNSIGQARGIDEAADRISAAIDFARSEAVARGTYVWLGIDQQTNAGNLALRLGIVCSKDGTTNSAGANLLPLARSQLIDRAMLVPHQQIPASGIPNHAIDLSSFNQGVPFTNGGTSFADRRTIAFTPLGEAGTNPAPSWSSSFNPFLAIGLRPSMGTTAATNSGIIVLLDGSVGIPTLRRID